MQQFGASAFNIVVHWRELGEVKMSAPRIILELLPSLCQKLSYLVEVWRSYNKIILLIFFWNTVYVYLV